MENHYFHRSIIYFYGICSGSIASIFYSTEHEIYREFSSAGSAAGSCAQRPSGRDAGCRAGPHGTSLSPAEQRVCPAGNGRVISLQYSIFGRWMETEECGILHTERAFKLEQKAFDTFGSCMLPMLPVIC